MKFFAVNLSLVFGLVFNLSSLSVASQKPHLHGSGSLNLAFDKTEGSIEFDAPADSVLGFEYKPKSKNDLKGWTEAQEILGPKFNEIVKFEPSLGCEIKLKGKVILDQHGKHSDVESAYTVKCKKPLAGSAISFDFKLLKFLFDVEVKVLVDDFQTVGTYKQMRNETAKPLVIPIK